MLTTPGAHIGFWVPMRAGLANSEPLILHVTRGDFRTRRNPAGGFFPCAGGKGHDSWGFINGPMLARCVSLPQLAAGGALVAGSANNGILSRFHAGAN